MPSCKRTIYQKLRPWKRSPERPSVSMSTVKSASSNLVPLNISVPKRNFWDRVSLTLRLKYSVPVNPLRSCKNSYLHGSDGGMNEGSRSSCDIKRDVHACKGRKNVREKDDAIRLERSPRLEGDFHLHAIAYSKSTFTINWLEVTLKGTEYTYIVNSFFVTSSILARTLLPIRPLFWAASVAKLWDQDVKDGLESIVSYIVAAE